MSRRIRYGLALIALAASLLPACGSPKVSAPGAMDFLYLPLDGVVDIDAAAANPVVPAIFFSDTVDPKSVTSTSVTMQTASRDILNAGPCDPRDRTACECTPWTLLDDSSGKGQAVNNSVVFTFETGKFQSNLCYRLTCTTALKGVKQGNLRDIGSPVKCRPSLGVEEIFCTK